MASIGPSAPILLLGASGPIGQFLIPRLAEQGVTMMAVSRNQPAQRAAEIIWIEHDLDTGPLEADVSVLIGLGPLRHVLAQVRNGGRLGRVIAMSSASTLFKVESADPAERALMNTLIELEAEMQSECDRRDIALTLLKPTMIYAPGRDTNVTRIADLTGRLGAAPYCGRGLRQPVHADDLARLILNCLTRGQDSAGVWLLGGGETLSYPAMLRRISSINRRSPRMLRLPVPIMKFMLRLAHKLGRLRDIRPAMLERQGVDLLVDDSPAREFLNWNPRAFRP